MATSDKSSGGDKTRDARENRAPAPNEAGAGMGTGMERTLGGGPDSIFDADQGAGDQGDADRDRDNALGGAGGVRGTMSGGINDQGRADVGQAESSFPTIGGKDDPSMQRQGPGRGTTGPSWTSDAGGGSDTVGGLTGGVGGTQLPDDKRKDEELRRQRYGADEGKASQHDSNIKTD